MAAGARFAFLPPEETGDSLFELGDDKPDDGETEDAFRDSLFESISEAHYLPSLEGHDEALLESLVEKGCEDNQIIGRLDRLSAQLATDTRYEEALLGEAPVADIIERLESLESPSRSAAQGLLHLRHLPSACRAPPALLDPFVPDDVFAPDTPPPVPDLAPAPAADCERRLRSDGEPAEVMYTEQIPDLPDGFDYEDYEDIARPPETTPVLSDSTSSREASRIATDTLEAEEANRVGDVNDLGDIKLDILEAEMAEIDFKMEDLKKEEPKEEEIEMPTDLSTILELDPEEVAAPAAEQPSTELQTAIDDSTFVENESLDKIDDLPKDLSMHRRLSSSYASPRRIEIPRAPSRESDAMQSPQPSGIPAISSPEVFNAPTSRCKTAFLEYLYGSSPSSPKMYTSEVTIQHCVPLNLGKHRKSASPTVSSCSDDIRTATKEQGEPQEKRVRRESHDLAKICNLLKKCGENKLAEAKKKNLSEIEQLPPLKQLELLRSNKNFNLPDQMLIPRNRLTKIIGAPGKEIPALLMERPQLNMPEILQDPNIIADPELMVISLEQIRQLIIHNAPTPNKTQTDKTRKPTESDHTKENAREPTSGKPISKHSERSKSASSERTSTPGTAGGAGTPQPAGELGPRLLPAVGHLAADDIDAANTAAAYQMGTWLPAYVSQMEACSQNAEFLKALGSSAGAGAAYASSPYTGLSQMFHPSRFMNMSLPNVPMMSQLDYESRMIAMWHEAFIANAAHAQRHKQHEVPKEAPAPPDYSAQYAQALLRQGKQAARAGYGPPRGSGGYAAGPVPPYAPRAPASRSPPSPLYANNNYLQSAKQADGSPRPRISVKSLQSLQSLQELQELQHTVRAAARRAAPAAPPAPPAPPPRRRDEPEVGSTTGAGELPAPPPLLPPLQPPLPPHPSHAHMHMPPHPHDPAAYSLWHPLFSNQKGYTSPWSWTTVTATGD